MENIKNQILVIADEKGYALYVIVALMSLILYLISSRVILRAVSVFFKKTSTQFDDILLEKKVFSRLPFLIPLIFVYNFKNLLSWPDILDRVLFSLIALIFISLMSSFLNALNEMHLRSSFSKKISIKSYIQVTKLLVNIFGFIVVIAILAGRSPVYFLSGLGALTAVLLLVFKDTILSLVSSVQISSNDLFKVGDWIEVPQFGADGDVIDIALHSIKIQNWDKTISIIPTNKLLDSSFKNWRGMSESGGRRIKRSINIDMNSIKFCSTDMIERFRKFKVIGEYIDIKLSEIEKHNTENNVVEDGLINGRSLTNIGTFRAYIEGYLRNHNKIHDEMIFLVRQLSPSSSGLPIEVYVFANDTDWINYESIQSDIFDHLLAVVPEFDLKVFQHPSGSDFNKIL